MASLGASWVVKRLTKVFLKRHLSHLLATEVDVQQLEIQLENGCFEIKDCLLDSEYLNSKLTEYPVSVQSALVERITVSLFPLTIECHGVAVVLFEQALDNREREPGNDISEEKVDKNSKSVLEDGLGLVEDMMQGLFSKLSITGKDILISATLLTGHELCLVTKQISLVSDAKEHGRRIDLDGLSFKVVGNEGVEHFRTNPIKATVLLSQESYSHKESEPKTVLSFTILQKITLYATEVAISLLQHLIFVLEKWKSVFHLGGEIPVDFSRSLQKVLGLPESIDSEGVNIWQTLEDRAEAGNLDDSQEDESAMSALDNLMSAIFFSTESILQGNQEDGQHPVYCVKGQIPGCNLKLCNSTEHLSCGSLYFSLEDIDLLCTFKGPYECDVSFASFQICNQSDIVVQGGEDQASIFDDWLMPEDSIVFSSGKNESTMSETLKKLENLENEQAGRPSGEEQTKKSSIVPIFCCRQQGYRQRISATFSDSVRITMNSDLVIIWLDNLKALRVLSLSEREEIGKDHQEQKQDFELSLNFHKILLGASCQNADQRLRCVLMLQTEHEGTSNHIASEGLHALTTPDSVSIAAQVELTHLSIGTDKTDSDFLQLEGMKFQYLKSDETTIAIKSKNDDLRGQIYATNFDRIETMIKHMQQNLGFSGTNSKSQVNTPYSLTLDAATIRCEVHADFGYVKGSVHLVDLTFRSADPTMSCEEVNLDILDAAIWGNDSEGSIPMEPSNMCFCEIKSLVLLLHSADQSADAVFQMNGKSICIGHQKELVSISTISLEHLRPNAGIVAMLSGLRAIHDEYLKVNVANAYLLLNDLKVNCFQRALECIRNMFVPREIERQRHYSSFEKLSSASTSAELDPLLYDCDVLNSEMCGLAHEGIWYDKVITNEYSESASDSVEVKRFYRSDYVGTEIKKFPMRKRSLDFLVDRFELLYENDLVDPAGESHGSLRFNCTTLQYQKSRCNFETFRISVGSVSAYFSYQSSSDNVHEDLVLEMPRKSSLRSEDAFIVDFQEHQGKITLSIKASGFRLCIRYSFVQWLSETCKRLSIGDWEDIGEESELSFDLRFCGAACSFSYVPSTVKLSSIRSKSAEDLFRLVPKMQAELWLCEANLVDAIELQAGGRMLVSIWLNDITKVQLNRFLLDLPGYRAMRQIKERANWNLDDSNLEHVALRCLLSLARYLMPDTEPTTS